MIGGIVVIVGGVYYVYKWSKTRTIDAETNSQNSLAIRETVSETRPWLQQQIEWLKQQMENCVDAEKLKIYSDLMVTYTEQLKAYADMIPKMKTD